MKIEWRLVDGFTGYEVSNMGQVRSRRKPSCGVPGILCDTYRMLTPCPNTQGYLRVGLRHASRPGPTTVLVSRLVAKAFLDPAPYDYEVAHLDGNKINNRADNLAWTSHKDDLRMMKAHGNTTHFTEDWHRCKINNDQVRLIRASPHINDAQFAERFHVTPSCIGRIRNGTRRALVP